MTAASGSTQRKRIAILGGGVGGMATAFELTSKPGWQDEYQVTLYQMGWRLGGKGASGRNAAEHERIEEHGLHIWLGFYDNAFNLIRRCYRELGRPPTAPLATWQDAFKKQDLVVLEELVRGKWIEWPTYYPPNDLVPGDESDLASPWEHVISLLEWMRSALSDSAHAAAPAGGVGTPPPSLWQRVVSRIGRDIDALALDTVFGLLTAALELARMLGPAVHGHSASDHHGLLWLLDKCLERLWAHLEKRVESDDLARRLWITLDLLAAAVRGMILDGAIFHGFDHLDRWELTEWLRRNGASALALDSAPVRGGYDLAFAYRAGDPQQRWQAAGAAMRAAMRMSLAYKGAFMWKMQAGMGDTIFAPMYDVLRRRGVDFRFFHRVVALHPSSDGSRIDSIDMNVQATVNGGAAYQPLRDVLGLPCWPSEPLYEQLVEGDALRSGKVNLESAWTTWKGTPATLRNGVDFDIAVLAVPPGSFPLICSEILTQNERWRRMVKCVETVRTQAFQLWLEPDLAGLGWTRPVYGPPGSAPTPPVLGAWVQPMNTWADMSQLIVREDWPPGTGPKNIAYFCGPMPDSPEPPYFSDPDYPLRETDAVKQTTATILESDIGSLWPAAVSAGTPRLDWSKLVAPAGVEGRGRLDRQYFRANVDPSERYVLTPPRATEDRLPSGACDYSNLFLAGDWTRNGLNTGCVEGAVMSGMQASRAICGFPAKVIGESDLPESEVR